MASTTTTETKKPGKPAKYTLNLDGAKLTNVTLAATDKKSGKTYTEKTQSVKVEDLGDFLAIFGNDEDKAFAFVSESLTRYIQTNARQKLTIAKQGPEKSAVRMINSLGSIMDQDEAINFVLSKLAAQGNSADEAKVRKMLAK